MSYTQQEYDQLDRFAHHKPVPMVLGTVSAICVCENVRCERCELAHRCIFYKQSGTLLDYRYLDVCKREYKKAKLERLREILK